MSLDALHTLYAVRQSGSLIDEVTDLRVSSGINDLIIGADGSHLPTFSGMEDQSPRIGFTSLAISAALGVVGYAGLKITTGALFDAWFQKIDQGGTRVAGANHFGITVNEGMIVPRTITAGLGSPASINYDVVPSYDGSNNPLVFSTIASLPAGATVDELYTVGKGSVNGTALTGVVGVTIDFGISLYVNRADGDYWPTFVAIRNIVPSIRFQVIKADALNTFGLTGTEIDGSSGIAYLRKIDQGGTRVADATLEHIEFKIEEGRCKVMDTNATHDGHAVSEVVISATHDGSNNILAIDTTAAIP